MKPAAWTPDDWATPTAFVGRLAMEFCPRGTIFTLDPCATERTAKAPTFYTKADNGLRSPWFGRVFLNPPFSNIAPWVKRAAVKTRDGKCDLVVAILPCSLDTGWFHEWVLPYAELHFIRGRIQFLDAKGKPATSPRHPLFIAAYRKGGLTQQYISYSWRART